jgi:predicted dehydrogenase
MVNPVRVGVIGCGWIAQTAHLTAYVGNARSRLVAICDKDEALLRRIGDEYRVKNRFLDHRELLESGLVDAVSICTPTATHSNIAVDAANSGVNILCEKPLAADLSEADRIVRAVRENKVKFMIAFNCRFLPNHVKTREYLQSGRIGQPLLIKGEAITAGPYRAGVNEADLESEAASMMGAFFDMGSHLADLILWMGGEARDVYGAFATNNRCFSVDDTATALVRLKSGVLGTLIVSWIDLPDYQAMSDARVVQVIGTKGKIESEFTGPSLFYYGSHSITSKMRGRIRIIPAGLNPKVPDEGIKWSYREEIDRFLESLLDDKEPPVCIEDGVRALKLVVAAYESAKLGRAVSLE